jgi:tetratricopeptide (TPR) repeat protein
VALELKPGWGEAWFRLGYLRLLRSDYPAAVEAFTQCLAAQAPWAEAELNLALAYWRLNDLERAEQAFRRALEADSGLVPALRGLAILAIDREDTVAALEFQARLIDHGERSAEIFYNTGLLLQKSGQMEDAVRLYREALVERPNFAEALLNLGHALKSQGLTDEAKVCWSQALTAKPELAAGYFDPA